MNFTEADLSLSKCHTISRYTRKCNFIYVPTKSAALHIPSIFMKFTNAYQHYVLISCCTEFQRNWKYVWKVQMENL